MKEVIVIGGGLAGTEAAWQLSRFNIKVKIYEMRPHKKSPAHHTEKLAELVCSNSLRSDRLENAPGLLKHELRRLGSIVIEAADKNRVPAGGALAVDREGFSEYITCKIEENPFIEVIKEEVKELPLDSKVIVATGPLSSDAISEAIKNIVEENYLYFFDAAAPIVTNDSLDYDIVFRASRYDRGNDYINCPMSKEEYDKFYNELINAECVNLKGFERKNVFEGCMPIEVMAYRGRDTLRFGPLKPVGLINPKTGEKPYAVVQLRQDDKDGRMYNLVGFQTHLKFGEQKRVFSLIPGLKNAEFVRYGVMHRNTFINSPALLNNHYQLEKNKNIYFAGQITGVEGYIESTSSGLASGINMALDMYGENLIDFTNETAIGALANYISQERKKENFQPMNVNYGIIKSLDTRIRNKAERNRTISEKALKKIDKIALSIEEIIDRL